MFVVIIYLEIILIAQLNTMSPIIKLGLGKNHIYTWSCFIKLNND